MKHRFSEFLTKTCATLLLMACFLMFLPVANAQQNVAGVMKDSLYTILGDPNPSLETQTQYFTVPANVYKVKIQCWGAGAAGAYMNGPGLTHGTRAGAGGGGGAYARVNELAVTPGQVLTVVIGQGGYGSSDIHGNGGDSYVQLNGVTKVLAKGAEGLSNDVYETGGNGGQKSSCIGDVSYSGGNGGAGKKGDYAGSGAGGGVAGISSNGHNGGNGIQPAGDFFYTDERPSVGGAPGTGYPFASPNTGYGANGVVSHGGTNGNNAVNFGGGGSGGTAWKASSGNGGDGGDGAVMISYEMCAVNAGSIKPATGCVVAIVNDVEASGSEGTYFWQKSSNQTSWTTISGASNKDYTPTETAYYRRGFNATCGSVVYSNTIHAEVGTSPSPGFITLYGQADVTTYVTCVGNEVDINLAAVTPGGTPLNWQYSNDGGTSWNNLETKASTQPVNVYITSITTPMKYRYYFETPTSCQVYSNNNFAITIDEGVIERPDFYFDTNSVNIVLQYGDYDTVPYIATPIYNPTVGVTLTNNVSTLNQGQILGRVGVGTHTIDWTVSDCGGSKIYTKKYIVSYPACDDLYTTLDADGNVYNTVRIGAECWTRENLRTLHYNNGDTVIGSYIYVSNMHNDTLANLANYGRLYNWIAAANLTDSTSQPVQNIFGHVEGICPTGWVLPTVDQYNDLASFNSVDLRSTNLWLDGEGTNLTNLTLLPGGCYNASNGRCEDLLGMAYFWTDQEISSEKTLAFWVDCHCYQVLQKEFNKANGMSVRCIKEKTPYAPTVVTLPATDININTATLNGNVADAGELTITERGFCYAAHSSVSMQNAITVPAATTGTGAYSIAVSGLTYDVRYYVRAYAINAIDTSYGEELSFVPYLPTDTITFMPNGATGGLMAKQVVSTGVPTAIHANTFTHGGNWEFIGWNTSANDSVAYAPGATITTNGNDTLYAQWHTWCTGTAATGEMGAGRVDSVKDYDNNWYKVVEIGNQCWLKENLKTTHYANGTYIEARTVYSTTTAYRAFPGITGQGADTNNVALYGHLYNWKAVMGTSSSSSSNPSGVRGICPSGWHVPSGAEWDQLGSYVKSQSEYVTPGCSSSEWGSCISKALASTMEWTSSTSGGAPGDDMSANNATGFSALPAGNVNSYGSVSLNDLVYFWSSTQFNDGISSRYGFISSQSSLSAGAAIKECYFSVRCVRDPEPTPVPVSLKSMGKTGGAW